MSSPTPSASGTVAETLRARRGAIIETWRRRVEELPGLRGVPPEDVVDHVPEFLEQMSAWIGGTPEAAGRALEALSEGHALQRLAHHVDIDTVLAEYQTLRESIVEEIEPISPSPEATAARIAIHRVLDLGVRESVKRFLANRDEMRDRFVAMLAHDLRGPMHAHVMAADAILRSPCDTEIHKQLAESLKNGGEQMSRMVFDLLGYARTQLGGLPIHRQPCDMAQICADVVTQARAIRPGRVLTLETSGTLTGSWDRDRVMQAIGNLVSNAFHHGADPVTVSAGESTADQLVITKIHNCGPPIAPELLATVFQPYERANLESREGLGLGLYIARQVALAHGGDCTVSSAVGGTTFTITWPRLPSGEPLSAGR